VSSCQCFLLAILIYCELAIVFLLLFLFSFVWLTEFAGLFVHSARLVCNYLVNKYTKQMKYRYYEEGVLKEECEIYTGLLFLACLERRSL